MYKFYSVSSLRNWLDRYSENLVNNSDFWNQKNFLITPTPSINDWIDRYLANKNLVNFMEISPHHMDQLIRFWIEVFLSKILEKPSKIVTSEIFFLLNHQASQLPLFKQLLNNSYSLTTLKKISQFFKLYDLNNSDLIRIWEQENSDLEETSIYNIERDLWKISLSEARKSSFYTFNEAIKIIKESKKKKELKFPHPKVFFFSGYQIDNHVRKFLLLLSSLDIEVHHISLIASLEWEDKKYPSFLKGWNFNCQQHKKFLTQNKKNINIQNNPIFEKKPVNKLEAIQAILTQGENTLLKNLIFPKEDNSIQIIETTCPLREVQVVKDKLLHILKKEDVLLEDIGIVVFSWTKYAHLIHAEMIDEGIPCQFFDSLPCYSESNAQKAFNFLLNLCESSFESNSVLSFLSNPCILSKFQLKEEDFEKFSYFVREEARIISGINSQHRETCSLPKTENHTWIKGFERAYWGLFCEDSYPLEEERSPITYSLSEWETISPFIELVIRLYKDTFWIKTTQLSLSQWCSLWQTLIDTYIDSSLEDEPNFLRGLTLLQNLSEEKLFFKEKSLLETPINFQVFHELLTIKSEEYTKNLKKHNSGIKIGSVDTLYALPFKVTFLMGLSQEDLRLSQEKHPLNLHEKYLNLYHESAFDKNREMFLRVLLQTDQRIVLSFSVKEKEKEENLHSSQRASFLNEILTFLESTKNPPWNWQSGETSTSIIDKENHPRCEYDHSYLSEKETFITYNQKISKTLLKQKELSSISFPSIEKFPSAQPQPLKISLSQLSTLFFKTYPLYFSKTLGIKLRKKSRLPIDVSEVYDISDTFMDNVVREIFNNLKTLEPNSFKRWQEIYQDLITDSLKKDYFSESVYLKENIKDWQSALQNYYNILETKFPLIKEEWRLSDDENETSIQNFTFGSGLFSLEGKLPFLSFTNNKQLYFIPKFSHFAKKKKFSESDQASILLQADLYQVHPQLKNRYSSLSFSLLNKKKSNHQYEWEENLKNHRLSKTYFKTLGLYLSESSKNPLPLYPEAIKTLRKEIQNDRLNSLEECKSTLLSLFNSNKEEYKKGFSHKVCPYYQKFPWHMNPHLNTESFEIIKEFLEKFYSALISTFPKEHAEKSKS